MDKPRPYRWQLGACARGENGGINIHPRKRVFVSSCYDIVHAGERAESIEQIAAGVRASYALLRAEGMEPLPGDAPATEVAACRPLAWKYCGDGFGGYAVYLFSESAQRDAACRLPGFRVVEPYVTVQR